MKIPMTNFRYDKNNEERLKREFIAQRENQEKKLDELTELVELQIGKTFDINFPVFEKSVDLVSILDRFPQKFNNLGEVTLNTSTLKKVGV